jgi:hypothetical protein
VRGAEHQGKGLARAWGMSSCSADNVIMEMQELPLCLHFPVM